MHVVYDAAWPRWRVCVFSVAAAVAAAAVVRIVFARVRVCVRCVRVGTCVCVRAHAGHQMAYSPGYCYECCGATKHDASSIKDPAHTCVVIQGLEVLDSL